MVMKAGASNHDKFLIRKLYMKGSHPSVISATLSIRPKHVAAIIKQIEDGTLKIGGRNRNEPLPGDVDGQIQELEPMAAKAILDEQNEAEKAALESKAAAQAAEIAELKAQLEGSKQEDVPDEPDKEKKPRSRSERASAA